ncbi:FAD-binding domain-containing protein [Aulographum hederae CBS 113979]|uniref:FAD-binding domain-containing protein n=1 Tax=Aulographum hederae CBS 113979 TaxID=1176131 RepID=A0A6G1GRL0_9PEZI|nr:FAD-binding domain-containing protein [Aulographum hederae CBS 113979]
METLKTLVTPSEIITPSSPTFPSETSVWAAQRDLKPALVIRPQTTKSLSRVIAHLTNSDLDFVVRSQGFGGASARDVVVSLTAFDAFEFVREEEVVYLGAGQSWGEYYRKMEEVAPEWTIVAARTPDIGVGGTTLSGGFSWLSGEFGCISDPENMLDAQIVKLDGSVIWASEEPELLWALRGTGGGFGVVTQFKFRARKYTQTIWAGPILVPNTPASLIRIAEGIVAMDGGKRVPQVAMFLYMMRKEILQEMGAEGDMLVVHAFDALGEAHGREAFGWVLEMQGVVDRTGVMNLRGVAGLQSAIGQFKNTTLSYWSPLALPPLTLTPSLLQRAITWYTTLPPSLHASTTLLFELFCTRASLSGRAASGWPRPEGFRHVLLLGTGCEVGAGEAVVGEAVRRVREGAGEVFGGDGEGKGVGVVPNAVEEFHDIEGIFQEHYPKLKELKRMYDPGNRLKGLMTA